MKKKTLAIILMVVILGIINYFALVIINIRYKSFLIFLFIIAMIIYSLFAKNFIKKEYKSVKNQLIPGYKIDKIVIIILVSFISLLIIGNILSSPIIFSEKYKNLIGKVETNDFNEDFSKIETTELPVVDHDLAVLLGDKKIGSERGLGSEFYVGEFSDIIYKGNLVSIAPLEYNGLFKWLNNKGTPGYIIVNKVTGKVELINEIDNRKLNLKYLPSAYFNEDLARKVYFSGNFDNELYKYYFELDEEGNPYWVIPKTKKTIGLFGGKDVYEVVILNAETGKINTYKIDEVPSWVDNVYPKELVLEQLDNWGYYVNGFFNTLFGEKDIIRTTTGSRRIYNKDQMMHYTGFTSSGRDESTVGFAFINTRTKKTTFYKVTGATEEAAMKSAEGKVQNLGYKAVFPIPLNIENYPTFFITLKDNKGLVKQYSFVNINDYGIVGNGETIKEARDSYLKLLNIENNDSNEKLKELEGIVDRIGFNIENGNTTYYIILKDVEGLYYVNSSKIPEITVTEKNDSVSLKVKDTNIIEFENNKLKKR